MFRWMYGWIVLSLVVLGAFGGGAAHLLTVEEEGEDVEEEEEEKEELELEFDVFAFFDLGTRMFIVVVSGGGVHE